MAENTATRRRGAELEEALLDAAWDELRKVGYGAFTIEGVAERARTSRPVVYRRWSSRAELAISAINHHRKKRRLVVPDTGSLRGDLIALFQAASARWGEIAAVVSVQMGQYFAETDSTPGDLRERLMQARERSSWMEEILRRAAARGEVDLERLTPRIAGLPVDLFRHELLMTWQPVSDEAIAEIVDDIFLPLVRLRKG